MPRIFDNINQSLLPALRGNSHYLPDLTFVWVTSTSGGGKPSMSSLKNGQADLTTVAVCSLGCSASPKTFMEAILFIRMTTDESFKKGKVKRHYCMARG